MHKIVNATDNSRNCNSSEAGQIIANVVAVAAVAAGAAERTNRIGGWPQTNGKLM